MHPIGSQWRRQVTCWHEQRQRVNAPRSLCVKSPWDAAMRALRETTQPTMPDHCQLDIYRSSPTPYRWLKKYKYQLWSDEPCTPSTTFTYICNMYENQLHAGSQRNLSNPYYVVYVPCLQSNKGQVANKKSLQSHCVLKLKTHICTMIGKDVK